MPGPSAATFRPLSARAVLVVLLFASIVRGGVLWLRADSLRSDPDGYRRLAENVSAKRVLGEGIVPTAYRPPLYPLLLAVFTRDTGLSDAAVAGLHLLLGVGTVWLVLWLGMSWGLGRYALLAAALVACDPILLNQSTLVMTETLATFLAALALALLTTVVERPSIHAAVFAGLAIALAALCRPAFLVLLLLAPLVVLWLVGPGRVGLRMAAIVLLAAICGLAPWAVRNEAAFGRPVISTTHGGYTLRLGNNPSFYDHLRSAPRGSVWSAEKLQRPRADQQGLDELREDRRAYAEAWRSIRAEPAMFLRACLHRIARLWGVLPYAIDQHEAAASRWLRYATAAWYTLALAWAAIGVWSLGRKLARSAWLFGVVLAAGFTVVHAVYWTDLRMRAPLVPVVALLAAAGGAWIASRLRDITT
jgi:4-amino-4-deoxy-L-arabinose transferase-like glycosyltransferase